VCRRRARRLLGVRIRVLNDELIDELATGLATVVGSRRGGVWGAF